MKTKLSDQEINKLVNLFKENKIQEFNNLRELLLKNHQDSYELFNLLGVLEIQRDNFYVAKKYFLKSYEQNCNYLPCIRNLINIYRKEKNYLKLKDKLIRYIEMDQASHELLLELGILLKNINQFKESIKYLKKFIDFNPKNSKAYNSLALAHYWNGDFKEAYEAFKKSIKLNDKKDKRLLLIYDLAEHLKYDLEPYLKEFQQILKNKSDLNTGIYLRIAKYKEKNKEFDSALTLYIKLNELKNDNFKKPYWANLDQIKHNIDKLKKIKFNPKPSALKSKPIFILGLPRSGTSLLEQMLSAHKNIIGLGELENFLLPGRQVFYQPEYLNEDSLQNFRTFSLTKIMNKYNFGNEKYFIDKNPMNFEIIPILKHVFPESKIIYNNRDSKDICWSIFTANLQDSFFNINLKSIIEYINYHKRLMDLYLNLYAEDIYINYYENLISEPYENINKILNFIGLKMDKNCLSPESNAKSIRTASVMQARNIISMKNVKRWEQYKDYLDPFYKELKQ